MKCFSIISAIQILYYTYISSNFDSFFFFLVSKKKIAILFACVMCVYEYVCMRVYSLGKRNKVNVHFKSHIKVMYTIYVLWINEKSVKKKKKNTFVIQFPSNRINNPLTEIKVLAKLLNVTFDSKQGLFGTHTK